MKIQMTVNTIDVGKEIGTHGSDLDIYALLVGLSLTNPEGFEKAMARMERRAERKAADAAPVEKITLAEALRQHMFGERLSRRDLASGMEISYPYLCQLLDGTKTPGKKALDGLTKAGVDTSRVQF